MNFRVFDAYAFGKLCKSRQQNKHTRKNVYKKGYQPMSDMNVLLLYPQKAYICIEWKIYILYRNQQ